MSPVFGVVKFQALVWLVVASAMVLLSKDAAVAAAASGLAVLGPSALFAWLLGRESDPRRMIAYGGAKLLMTITCLVVVLVSMKPDPSGYFAGFIGQYLAHLAGAWWAPRRRTAS